MSPDDGSGGLSHLDETGRAHMVDVGDKPVSERTAVAGCVLEISAETARLLADGTLPKGDALAVARVAGIQAAKRTSDLIPLCHAVALDAVEVEIEVEVEAAEARARVTSRARASDRTGVEMEALVAASVAALTLYDMVKAIQRDAVVTGLRLLSKAGGTRGDYAAEGSGR